MKTLLAILLSGLMAAAPVTTAGKTDEIKTSEMENRMTMYHELAYEAAPIEIYSSENLTEEILTDRIGKIIIEEAVGVVLNEDGDGAILGVDENYNYISYRNIEGIHTGDIIASYFVYNDANNAPDDIVIRTDRIILTASENMELYK